MIPCFSQLIQHAVQRMQIVAISEIIQKGQRMMPVKIIPKPGKTLEEDTKLMAVKFCKDSN